MSIIPSYDIEEINLSDYNPETRNIILSNLKNYTKLEVFKCYNHNLTELPNLPNSLIELYCSTNELTELPDLPNSLIYLECYYNNLTELPILPNTLIYLNCHHNNLTELPNLPNLLEHLNCSYNNLTELLNLPNLLKFLMCNNNNLTELPNLPNSLTWLYCKEYCKDNKLYLTYPNLEIKTINETNFKNRIIKRMKLLNRTLLLEHSAMISMNPKRIKRLLDNNEIDFFDGSFDNLTT